MFTIVSRKKDVTYSVQCKGFTGIYHSTNTFAEFRNLSERLHELPKFKKLVNRKMAEVGPTATFIEKLKLIASSQTALPVKRAA